jgi:hypothetical protein
MPVTQAQLDEFHRFASRRVGREGHELSWDELLVQWESEFDRETVNAAIREGLEDVTAGRFEPAEVVMEEIRREFGFGE